MKRETVGGDGFCEKPLREWIEGRIDLKVMLSHLVDDWLPSILKRLKSKDGYFVREYQDCLVFNAYNNRSKRFVVDRMVYG